MSGIARSTVDDMMALILARPFKHIPRHTRHGGGTAGRSHSGPAARSPASPRLAVDRDQTPSRCICSKRSAARPPGWAQETWPAVDGAAQTVV
jgi:hypothetical protein